MPCQRSPSAFHPALIPPFSQHSQLGCPWLTTPQCAALAWLTGCHAMPAAASWVPCHARLLLGWLLLDNFDHLIVVLLLWASQKILSFCCLGKSKNIVILMTLGKLPPFSTQSVRLPLVNCPSLCGTCVACGMPCHAMPAVTKCLPPSPYTSPFPQHFSHPAQPNPAQPNPTQPSPALPNPAPPRPTQPNPAQPCPTQPNPAPPSPTQPNPAPPSPTRPSPTRPSPTRPSPTPPSPTRPSPTRPSPAQPGPAQPGPALPGPAQPGPALPNPAQPCPTRPSPAQPGPALPNPTQPNPRYIYACQKRFTCGENFNQKQWLH